MDSEGNTTNPTKSSCDPFVFNTVLTRSKSLVVVVGSPMALLRTEEHKEKLYGKKARCWSTFFKHCLENNTFFIPPVVKPLDTKALQEFQLKLKTRRLKSRHLSAFAQLHETHNIDYNMSRKNISVVESLEQRLDLQPLNGKNMYLSDHD